MGHPRRRFHQRLPGRPGSAGHTSTEYPHLPHFQAPTGPDATVNHRPPAILMLSWSRKNRSDLSHCPALNGSASRATCIQQMNYTPDQSSSFGDAPPRPTPTPAAGPTANGLKRIDSKCLIGNWLCSVKKLSRRNPPSSNSAILIPTARQRSGHPYFARTIKELSSSAITLHQPAAKPGPNSLESIDSTCPIENWLCSVKNEFRARIRTPSTKQHKPAQPTTHHPQAITPAPYFRSTLKLGSSCTFTGACGSATLNVTGPSAVRTQCVKVLPCPN